MISLRLLRHKNKPITDRNEKILFHINRDKFGLEIGPSHRPIAPKREGFHVLTVDHLDQEGLRKKYQGQNVNLESIEPVDFIWQGQALDQLIGKKEYFNWIVASHVIEHTTDLIGFLQECSTLLKEGGILSLVIPDKRYCFDYFRSPSSLSQIIDSHYYKKKYHSPSLVAEYYLNAIAKKGKLAWGPEEIGEYKFIHDFETAMNNFHQAKQQAKYIDIHAWCFVPHSFRLLIHDLNLLKLISLQELCFFQTAGSEFYVSLIKGSSDKKLDRLQLLKIAEKEEKNRLNWKQQIKKSLGLRYY